MLFNAFVTNVIKYLKVCLTHLSHKTLLRILLTLKDSPKDSSVFPLGEPSTQNPVKYI